MADNGLLAKLPPALPKSLAAKLGALLPAEVAAQLAPLLPTVPDMIPLAYTASTDVELAADTVTGAPLSATLKQRVVANVALGDQRVSLLPVLAMDVTSTKASQKQLADTSGAAARKLTLVSVVLPVSSASPDWSCWHSACGAGRHRSPSPQTPSGRR